MHCRAAAAEAVVVYSSLLLEGGDGIDYFSASREAHSLFFPRCPFSSYFALRFSGARERGLIMFSIESRVDSVTRAEEEKSVPRKGGVDKGGSLSFRVYYALLRGGYRDATV